VEQGFNRSFPFSKDFTNFFNLLLLEKSESNDLLVFSGQPDDFVLNFQKLPMLFQLFLRFY